MFPTPPSRTSPKPGFAKTASHLPLVIAFACASCDSKSPPAAGASTSGSSGSFAAAPSGQSSPAAAKTGPVKPREHSKLLALIDLSKFPAPPGAERQSITPVAASFSLPKQDDSAVPNSAKVLEGFASSQGWKPVAGGSPWSTEGGVVYYEKDGARLSASIGVSRGFKEGTQDVNAGIFLNGDVDVRSIPLPPESVQTRSDFTVVQFTAPGDLASVRKFNKDQIPALGWTEYLTKYPGGYEMPKEQMEKQQSFIQNGITLQYNFTPKDGKTEVLLRTQLLHVALPVPPQPDFLQIQDSPPLLSCFLKKTPAEILAWCQEVLGKEGWTAAPLPAKEEGSILHQFQKEGRKPLLLECLSTKTDTIMRIREVEK